MQADSPTPIAGNRGIRLLLAGVLAVAVTGYFVGLQQSRRASQAGSGSVDRAHPERDAFSVPLAPKYRDLGEKGPLNNRGWKSNLADLPTLSATAPPAKPPTDEEVKAALSARMQLRAFDGAPPAMPHPGSGNDAACLLCHVDGKRIGDKVARRMSHPFLAACTQCHVETRLEASKAFASSFEPLLPVARGERAYPGAPPAVPHSIWMRNDCLSCHGPAGPTALQTTHPERLGCVQCHPSGSPLDFVPRFAEKLP